MSQKFIHGLSPEEKSRNLADALLEFAHHSNSYKELSEILPEVRVLQQMLLHKINSKGDVIERELVKDSDPSKKVIAEKSNLNSMIDKWIDMQVKGNMKDPNWQVKVGELVDENGDIIGYKYIHGTDVVDTLIKTNSLVKIGLSPISALSNISFGQISNAIEATGGRFFGLKDLHNANTIFWKQTFNKDSKMNKLLEEFNLLREQDDYELAKNPELKGKLSIDRFQQLMYAPQKMGEKWNQATTVLAVMIKEGYITKNGELTEKWTNSDEKEKNELVNKTQRINSMTHGRYSQQEAATASQKVWFRAVSQFRKWIFSMYEARFDKKQYDIDLQVDIEGRYRTLGKLILNFKDTMKRLQAGELTELEAYNMKKNLTEVVLWATTFLSYTLLFGGDDEESKKRRKNPIAKLGISLLERAAGDLDFFYSPNQIANLSSNAVPVGKFVMDITKAIEYIPYAFDYNNPKAKFKSGLNKGKNKELVQVTKLSPALAALLQAEKKEEGLFSSFFFFLHSPTSQSSLVY